VNGSEASATSVHHPEPSVATRIQQIVDRLGAEFHLAVAVDDVDFRLQFYSPQQGTLDRVRVDSILLRDSPTTAKEWVRDHGVEVASGPTRVPESERLGLLPRLCVPIKHQETLLGYLWIIEADRTLPATGVERAAQAASTLGPLLYRWHYFDRLDRHAEREVLTELIDTRTEVRTRGVERLRAAGHPSSGAERVLVVKWRTQPEAPAVSESEQFALELALEVALEGARATFPPSSIRFVRMDRRAVVLLSGAPALDAQGHHGAAHRLYDLVRPWLEGQRVVLGVGRMVDRLEDVHHSHMDADEAAQVATRDPSQPSVLDTRFIGVHRGILRLSAAEAATIVSDVLGRLIAHRDGTVLLETLQLFLDRGGDVSAVATDLDVHRSTIYTRLHRVEQLLETSLADGTVRMGVQQALLARRLHSVDAASVQPPAGWPIGPRTESL
jgi:hypothetical protein